MKTDDKMVRRALRAVLLCGAMVLCCLCAPVRGAGAEQSQNLLATERQALQEILNKPNLNAETKALVREMLDWNQHGGTFAEFQKAHAPTAPAPHAAARAAGEAIFGGHAETPARMIAVQGETATPRRLTGASEPSGMQVATPLTVMDKRIVETLADGKASEVTVAKVVRGQTDSAAVPLKTWATGNASAAPAKGPVAAWVEDTRFGPATTQTLKPQQTLTAAHHESADHLSAVPATQSGVTGGHIPAPKEAIGHDWNPQLDPNFARTTPLQPRMVVREAEASALSDMARSTTAAKKVYTGPAFETGHGKGDLIGANLGNVYGEGSFGPVRALNSEVSDHIRGAALAPAAQPAPMVPGVSYHTPPPGYRGPDVIQNAVPSGVTVHTPPPPKPVIGDKCGTGDGYRRLDASPPRPAANTVPVRSAVAQLITVDAFCPKHGKYGGQVRPGEKLECPLCKAEKNRPIIPIR